VVAVASIASLPGGLPSLLRGSAIRETVLLHFVFGFIGALLVLVIAAIAAFVGWVGEVMLLFELSSQTGVQGFRTAAILLILALLCSFVSVIPHTALAVAFLPAALQIAALVIIRDSTLKALLPPPPPPPGATP